MRVVAQSIYTYANHYSTFVYNSFGYLRHYRPIIFTHGLGTPSIYQRYDIYAPNAITNRADGGSGQLRETLISSTKKFLRRIGLANITTQWLAMRGTTLFLDAIAKQNVCLMHAHFGPTAIEFLRVCKQASLPLVLSTYGYDVGSLPKTTPTYLSALREVFNYASAVLAMSRDMQQDLIALGCPAYKIIVHHTSVNPVEFTPSQRNSEKPLRILSICSYSEKKGLPYLVESYGQICRDFPNSELRIIGRPAQVNDVAIAVDKIVEQYDLQERVQQLPSIPINDWQPMLAQEYAAAHIFALPSVTASDGDKEGIPTVLLEAQASGLPVVSSQHAGIPEAIVDGVTGLLVNERDVQDLTAKLGALLGSKQARLEMGNAGRKNIMAEFNVEIQAARLEKIYDAVIEEWHRDGAAG